jgi:peptidoglycan/LPS O-acetylase OafA/YrhL
MGTTAVWVAFGGFLAILICGMALFLLARRRGRREDEVMARVGRACLTMGSLALLLLFFSFEQIRLFGSRFWYLLWAAGGLTWALLLAHFALHVIPRRQAAEAVTKERAKYLPKRKRKK